MPKTTFQTRRTPLRLLSVLALTLVAPCATGNENNHENSAARFAPDAVREQVKQLASDAFRGRGSGDIGNEKAAEYIAREFAKHGLKPIGTDKIRDPQAALNGSGFYQPFRFPAGRTVGKGNRLTVAAGGKSWNLRPGTAFEPSSVSAGGKAEGEIVFVGYGISAPRLKHDDYGQTDLKGKVALLLAGYPGNAADSPLREFAGIDRKAREARDRGASAVLVVLPREQTNFPRSPFDFANTSDAGLPVLRVKYPDVARWTEATGGPTFDALITQAERGPLDKTVPLNATAQLSADVTKVEKVTANVVGLLEGSDPALKQEVVIIGAHMDHLGVGGPGSLAASSRPAIHHGADDNASGTAGVLQLARHFSQNRPKRSILFMAFSGEELGLLGSAYYTQKPIIPITQTIAMLNMDMIGRLRNDELVVGGSGTAKEWDALLNEASKDTGLKIARNDSGFGASDQQSFYLKDIPVLFFFTGLHDDYHKPSDTWDKINYEGVTRILSLVADSATRVANMPQRPTFQRITQGAPSGSRRFAVYLGSVPSYSQQAEGVLLEGVREGSPAEKAGMRAGDIIIRFADRPVKNIEDYVNVLTGFQPGDKVQIVVLRDGKEVTLEVTLAARSRE